MDYDLKEFDPDVFIQWFITETKAGRMPEERIKDPNWGVSTEFILAASYDSVRAERARIAMPILFVIGFLLGGYFL